MANGFLFHICSICFEILLNQRILKETSTKNMDCNMQPEPWNLWKMTRGNSHHENLYLPRLNPGISLGSPTSGVYLIQFMTSQTFRQVCIRHSGGKNLHLEVPQRKKIQKGWSWNFSMFFFFATIFLGIHKSTCTYRSTYVYDYIFI